MAKKDNAFLDFLYQAMDDWGLGALRKVITDKTRDKNLTKNDYHDLVKYVMGKARAMREEALRIDTTADVPSTAELTRLQNQLNNLISLPKSSVSKDIVIKKRNDLETEYSNATKKYEQDVKKANKEQQDRINKQQKLLDAAGEYEQLALAKVSEYNDLGSHTKAAGTTQVQELRNEIESLFPKKRK